MGTAVVVVIAAVVAVAAVVVVLVVMVVMVNVADLVDGRPVRSRSSTWVTLLSGEGTPEDELE